MPKKSTLGKLKKAGKGLKRVGKDVKSGAVKDVKTVYKKSKNNRYYKTVNGRPRFVSKKEYEENSK